MSDEIAIGHLQKRKIEAGVLIPFITACREKFGDGPTREAIAAAIRREAAIATRTVGLIVTPKQAEAIVAGGQADMVALARAILDDPHWAWHAARVLGADIKRPNQYLRSGPALWPGAAMRD